MSDQTHRLVYIIIISISIDNSVPKLMCACLSEMPKIVIFKSIMTVEI
jgi:hypothetical protein